MLNFDEYRTRGQKFYRRLARGLSAEADLSYADRFLTTLFNVLRDRFTFGQSLTFLSFLPMHLKGVYVHGWKLNQHPKELTSVSELLEAMRLKYPNTSGRKLSDDSLLSNEIRTTLGLLQKEVPRSADFVECLPEAVRNLLGDEIVEKRPVVEMLQEGGKHFPEIQPIKNDLEL